MNMWCPTEDEVLGGGGNPPPSKIQSVLRTAVLYSAQDASGGKKNRIINPGKVEWRAATLPCSMLVLFVTFGFSWIKEAFKELGRMGTTSCRSTWVTKGLNWKRDMQVEHQGKLSLISGAVCGCWGLLITMEKVRGVKADVFWKWVRNWPPVGAGWRWDWGHCTGETGRSTENWYE